MHEPRLSAELEDENCPLSEAEWHATALRFLAKQLGVMNDFYFPLLGAATLIDGKRTISVEAEAKWGKPDLQSTPAK